MLYLSLILHLALCEEQCTYQSNMISIDYECSMEDLKDPYRPTMIRVTSPGCPYSPASQAQWEKAASLYPQVNFITVDGWKNTKISSLFGNGIQTPIHGLFLPNSVTLDNENIITNPKEISQSPEPFLKLINEKTGLYQIAPPLVSLSPMIIDSFYTAVDDPIILLYNSKCTDQVPFLNEWAKISNEVIFSNGVNPRIGMLDCSIYPDECQRWSHPYASKTPRALIFSSKTGNYEVLDTYNGITNEKIDGLYSNALSRPVKATPSPIPIPEIDTSVPPTTGYEVLENDELKKRTVESIRNEYKEANVAPSSACQTASECEPQTLDTPSACPNIVPSDDDHTNSLKMVNFLRGLAGLPKDVTEDADWSQKCYKAALNMHKIGKVPPDHIIKPEYEVQSYCGEQGNNAVSIDSLLSENAQSVFQSSYKLFMDEGTHNDGVVGHRRWLLHPNLKKIGIGFYPYKEEKFDGFRMMRPAVTVIRIKDGNSLTYIENSIPSNLKFISWPPEGPFPLEQLPSNWHISHTDFRTAKLEDLRIFVRRDDGAELAVKQAYLANTNSINNDALVLKMTDEALKRCQLLRTITVTVFNDKLKKVYRFSFELFDNNEVTETCLYASNKALCPASVAEENKFGTGSYQAALFTDSTKPVKVHVVEEIKLGQTKLSFTAQTNILLIGKPIDGTVVVGSKTTLGVQDPSKTSYEVSWDVNNKKSGKVETVLSAKSIDVIMQNENEQISVYDITFYTGRQTSLGLSKVIFTGENYDVYYSIGGMNGNFFAMASSSPAFQAYTCSGDDQPEKYEGAKKINSLYDMAKQTTNKRVIKVYIPTIEEYNIINLNAFIPGRKRDYQFITTGLKILLLCDMNISNVANSITFSNYDVNKPYTFNVNMPLYDAMDTRNICPMDFVTINRATITGTSSSNVIMPFIKGDQSAKNSYDPSNFNDIFPTDEEADSDTITAFTSGPRKTKCIITTSGLHSSYTVTYKDERKYNPLTFRAAPGSEEKPVAITLYLDDTKMPTSPRDSFLFFVNYQNLTLNMPAVINYQGKSKLQSYIGLYHFDNCGKVTFAGNDDTTPTEFEIQDSIAIGDIDYGLTMITPKAYVTRSGTYNSSCIHATIFSVSPNMKPTILGITVNESVDIDSSTVFFVDSNLKKDIQVNLKKSQSWWPSISLQNTQLDPKSITIDLGITQSASRLLASEEYESHSLITGIDSAKCETLRSKSTTLNYGKFAVECSKDKTELIAVKGKENAPILTPEDGQKPETSNPQNPPVPPQQTSGEEPVITPRPMPTKPPENVELIEHDNKESIRADELNGKLEDLFKDMPKESNNVAVVDVNNIDFNTELNENQFIKPAKGSTINYNGGSLNLVIPEKVDVQLTNTESSNLLIKGEGEVNIKFKEDSTKEDSINLNTKSQINGTVTITVPKTVKSFSFDSIELDSEGKVVIKREGEEEGSDSTPIDLSVNNVNTVSYSKAKLSNITIQKSLNIVQSSVLDIDNVAINTASIKYNIYDINSLNLNEPFITGKFNSYPISFDLTKAHDGDDKPTDNVEYQIVSGIFDGVKCNDWIPKLTFGNSGFNSKVCQDNPTLDSENKKIVIKFDPSKDKGDGGKLSAGAIAGIVIGVIAAVAIIVIVVVFVVLKRKKNLNNSSEDEAANNNIEREDV